MVLAKGDLATADTSLAPIPIRKGLFAEGAHGPRLLGSRCPMSGTISFPMEVVCPEHPGVHAQESVELAGRGTLVTFTTVFRSPPGFQSPYALGTIVLDEGPSLIAQLELTRDAELRCGTRVELVIGTVRRTEDGRELLGPRFRPVGG